MRQRGFTLIEGLIALVIIGVGLLSIASLQMGFIGGGSEAKARAVASKLAQEKMEDLRSFSQLRSGGAGTFGFQEIGDNTGGTEQADGTLNMGNGNYTISNVTYSLSWDSTDFFYAADGGGAFTTWSGTGNTGTAPSYPDYKAITVTASWTDQDGNAQQIQLNGVIGASDPADSARAGDDPPANQKPDVQYTEGSAPEYVSVELTDTKKKETGQPEPTVSQNQQFTTTQFDEVTYDTALETQRRDDFVSLNCECEQAGEDEAYTPTVYRIKHEDDVEESDVVLQTVGDDRVAVWDLGEKVTKRVGTRITSGQAGQQSEFCTICCRDHHDTSATDADGNAYPEYDPFRPNDTEHFPSGISGDHGHFYPDGSGVLQPADTSGDTYLEACRMVRVDGRLRVTQDWNLEAFQLMPGTFLQDSTNLSNYTSYVTDLVTKYVQNISGDGTLSCDDDTTAPDYSAYPQDPPAEGTDFTATFTNEPTDVSMGVDDQLNLISRGVYIDPMDSELVEELKCRISDNEDFLDLVPFHEVNVTKLANWSSSDSSKVSVTNEPLADDGTHSRGALTALAEGSSTVTASTERSNTGLTDTLAIDPDDGATANTLYDELAITVTSTSTEPDNPTLAGSISIGGGTGVNPSDVVFTAASSGVTCTKPTDEAYSCSLDANGDGSFTVSNYNSQKQNGVVLNNRVCTYDSAGTAVNPTSTVTDNNTLNEATTFTFSEETGKPRTMDIIIKQHSQNC